MKKLLLLLIIFTGVATYAPCGGDEAPSSLKQSKIKDFSFVQASDTHVSPAFDMPKDFSKLRSYECVSSIKDLKEVYMEPYKISAPKPSFMIVTGDVFEFSVPGVTWDVNKKYYEGIDMPVYFIAGNHDNTWVSAASKLRDLYNGINYSFDYGGCHFIGLNSASIQEPIQSFDEVAVNFLKDDLKKVDHSTPIFMYFHHPLYGNGFASKYDSDRILDLIRDHNVVLIMDGHGHSAVKHKYPGVDGVMGGSTFGKDPEKIGFNIVNLKDGKLYVAYKTCGKENAAKAMLEKTIPEKSNYVNISILSPKENEVFKTEDIDLKIDQTDALKNATGGSYEIDDEINGELVKSGSYFAAKLNADDLSNGAHFVRVKINIDGKEYQKSVPFFVDIAGRENSGVAQWRYKMNGSSQSTPLVCNNTVYVGSNDGLLYAINESTGKLEWTFDAGAEIISSPITYKNLILFGAGNGRFYALTTEGKIKWEYDAGAAVYSSPVIDEGGIVYFGNNKAELTALNANTGAVVWVNKDARFSVESKPFVTDKNVYFGAWDGLIYSVDKKSGKTSWEKPGPKNIELNRTVTYYGPADNGPLVAGGKVYITDRGYVAGMYKLDGTYDKTLSKGCSAIGFSEDEKSIYLRGNSKPLAKIDLDGNTLWESSETLGRLPVTPLEKDGKVFVCNNLGRFYAVNAKTGSILWQYQVTPKLYVMSGVSVNNGVVYSSGMDGYVTAFSNN